MFSTSIRAKLIAFVIVALVGTSYLGVKYVGFNFADSGYNVTAKLPEAGGLFVHSQVTYRGVAVGEVTAMHPTADGMEATLHINGDAPDIPRDSSLSVTDRSAIGEQYLNLSAPSDAGPQLQAGDTIDGTQKSLPPSIDTLLRTARDFTASVPSNSLNTVIDELYEASQGASQPVRRLVDTSKDFGESATTNFLVTQGLIENSDTVLATQQESSDSIKGFSRDLDLFARTLRDSDRDLRTLISNTPASAREISKLFDQVGPSLGLLMSNLITPAQVFGTNSAGVEDALIRLPEAVRIGWNVNKSKGLNLGLAQTYFDPLPCTRGYGGTQVRPGVDTKAGAVKGKSKRFNTKAGCTNPRQGVNVRGPSALPRQNGAGPSVSRAGSLSDLLGGN